MLSRPLFLLFTLLAPAFCQFDRAELVSTRPGRAEARVGCLIFHSDGAALNRDTGELAMRGHVHVTLPAREDHSVVRYGTGVVITDQAMGLTADRITVKNGLLQASGNIVVVPTDPELAKVQLRSDEMYMYLRIGDATLKGNVRPIGIRDQVVAPRPLNGLRNTIFRRTLSSSELAVDGSFLFRGQHDWSAQCPDDTDVTSIILIRGYTTLQLLSIPLESR
ncbi:MAG: hypothetical protein WDO73_08865 [Ignavibacteriota bacterium]